MTSITKSPSHSKETFLFAASRGLERASFYGIRSILVLYMINTVKLGEADASVIYGLFASSLIFTQLFGGFLGDLIIGNRRTIILGGILQFLGCLSFFIPSITGMYIGIGLTSLGSGLFSPNIAAQFGKFYLNKTAIIDSGFTILYTTITVGAILGTTVISLYTLEDYKIGFVIGSVFMLLSIVFFLMIKENKEEENEYTFNSNDLPKKAITVSVFILLVSLFWFFFNFFSDRLYSIAAQLLTTEPHSYFWNTLGSIDVYFSIPLGILFSFLWLSYRYHSKIKISIGFLLAAIGLLTLASIGIKPTSNAIPLIVVASFFIALAEFHVGPVLLSLITQNTNPKYLALALSLPYAFSFVVGRLSAICASTDTITNIIVLVSCSIASLMISGVLYFTFRKKKES